MKKIIIYLATFACLTSTILNASEISKYPKQPIKDLFENPPSGSKPNCNEEYRFKYDAEINSIDEFIGFLKKYQFEGELFSYVPTKDKLIPMYTYPNESESFGDKIKIDLDRLKTKVEILEIKDSKLLNKKIYKLDITDNDFSSYGWPWGIFIEMSNQGHVSIVFCAGI